MSAPAHARKGQVYFAPGCSIQNAARTLVEIAATGARAFGDFNGVTLTASVGSTADEIVSHYDREMKEAAKRWRASPAGKAVAKERRDTKRKLQAEADALADEVLKLDFANHDAVIAFLGRLQPCSDYTGVNVESADIVQAFKARGLVPNMCVGGDMTDRETVYRWLVGQALDGLTRGPAIHGVFHTFADDWRAMS